MADPGYQSVQAPDGSIAQFPSAMSDDDIQAVMAREFPADSPSAATAPPSTPVVPTAAGATSPAPPRAGLMGYPVVNDASDVAVSDTTPHRFPGEQTAPTSPMSAAQAKADADFRGNGYLNPTATPGTLSYPVMQSREGYEIDYAGPKGTYYRDYRDGQLKRVGDPTPQQGRTSLQDIGAGLAQGLRDVPDHTLLPAAQALDSALPGSGRLLTAGVPVDTVAKNEALAKANYDATSQDQDVAKVARFGGQQATLLPITVATDGMAEAVAPALETVPVIGKPAASLVRFATGRAAAPLKGDATVMQRVGNAAVRAASRSTYGAGQGAAMNAAVGGDPTAGAIAGGISAPLIAPLVNASVKSLAGIGPQVQAAGSKVVPQLIKAPAPMLTPEERGVTSYLGRQIVNDDTTVPDYLSGLKKGPDAPLPMAQGGDNLSVVGRAVANYPGKGRTAVVEAANGRMAGMGDRVLNAVNDTLGIDPHSAAGDVDAIIKNGRATVNPLYTDALSSPGGVTNDNLAALAQRPALSKALDLARTDLANAGENAEVHGLTLDPDTGNTVISSAGGPTPKAWDLTRQYLGNMVERDGVGRPIPDTESPGNYRINQLHQELTGELKGAMPGFGDAIDQAQPYKAVQGGYASARGKLFTGSPQDFQKMWDGSSTQAQAGIKARLAADALDKYNTGNFGPGTFTKAPGVQQKLATAFGPDAASQFIDQMNGLGREMAVYRPISGNSHTQLLANVTADAKQNGGGLGQDIAETVLAGPAAGHVAFGKLTKAALKSMPQGTKNVLEDPGMNSLIGQALSDPDFMHRMMGQYVAEQSAAKARAPIGDRVAAQVAPRLGVAAPTVPQIKQRATNFFNGDQQAAQ